MMYYPQAGKRLRGKFTQKVDEMCSEFRYGCCCDGYYDPYGRAEGYAGGCVQSNGYDCGCGGSLRSADAVRQEGCCGGAAVNSAGFGTNRCACWPGLLNICGCMALFAACCGKKNGRGGCGNDCCG